MAKRGRPPKTKVEPLLPDKPKGKRGGRQPGAGRPPREFDFKIFEGLCGIHCTIPEIQSVLNTEWEVLNKWCLRRYEKDLPSCYKQFSENGKMSLRRYQWDLAKKNTAMAIWLGKQYLNQKDDKVLIPVEAQNWPFFDTSKNPLNNKHEHSTRNSDATKQPILENEQPLLCKGQERNKDDL